MAVFMGSMLLVSTLLMLHISMPIWNAISYLQYLQFPWRFMEFVGLFGSIFCASSIYLIGHLIDGDELKKTRTQLLAAAGIMLLVFFVQAKYFKPQRFLNTTDAERTGFTRDLNILTKSRLWLAARLMSALRYASGLRILS